VGTLRVVCAVLLQTIVASRKAALHKRINNTLDNFNFKSRALTVRGRDFEKTVRTFSAAAGGALRRGCTNGPCTPAGGSAALLACSALLRTWRQCQQSLYEPAVGPNWNVSQASLRNQSTLNTIKLCKKSGVYIRMHYIKGQYRLNWRTLRNHVAPVAKME